MFRGLFKPGGTLRRPFLQRPPTNEYPANPSPSGFRFNPSVKLDTSQIIDQRGRNPAMTQRPVPPNPGLRLPPPLSIEREQELDRLLFEEEKRRYEFIAKELGTELRGASDYIPESEVKRLRAVAQMTGISFNELIRRAG